MSRHRAQCDPGPTVMARDKTAWFRERTATDPWFNGGIPMNFVLACAEEGRSCRSSVHPEGSTPPAGELSRPHRIPIG